MHANALARARVHLIKLFCQSQLYRSARRVCIRRARAHRLDPIESNRLRVSRQRQEQAPYIARVSQARVIIMITIITIVVVVVVCPLIARLLAQAVYMHGGRLWSTMCLWLAQVSRVCLRRLWRARNCVHRTLTSLIVRVNTAPGRHSYCQTGVCVCRLSFSSSSVSPSTVVVCGSFAYDKHAHTDRLAANYALMSATKRKRVALLAVARPSFGVQVDGQL